MYINLYGNLLDLNGIVIFVTSEAIPYIMIATTQCLGTNLALATTEVQTRTEIFYRAGMGKIRVILALAFSSTLLGKQEVIFD